MVRVYSVIVGDLTEGLESDDLGRSEATNTKKVMVESRWEGTCLCCLASRDCCLRVFTFGTTGITHSSCVRGEVYGGMVQSPIGNVEDEWGFFP